MAYYKTSPLNKKDKKTNVSYRTDNGNIYDVYKNSAGKYYIVDKNNNVSYFTTQAAINAINNSYGKGITIWKNGPGGYANTTTKSSTNNAPSNNNGSGGGGGSYSGGGGGGYSGGSSDARYEELLNEYKTLIDELKKPKVWTAEELAKHFGVENQYNMDYLTKMYQDETNKYYTDAIERQTKYNQDSELSNSSYANNLLKSYLSSYQNAAPTALGRGTRAANALTTMLGADMSNETSAANLNSIVNNYIESQKSDLENDKVQARDRYNELGKWLVERGTAVNTAEVQDYINSLKAYETAYAGIRNAQNNLASTAAAAYQQAANAALAQNQYNATKASDNILRQVYKAYYGENNNNWEKAYYNNQSSMNSKNVSGNQLY